MSKRDSRSAPADSDDPDATRALDSSAEQATLRTAATQLLDPPTPPGETQRCNDAELSAVVDEGKTSPAHELQPPSPPQGSTPSASHRNATRPVSGHTLAATSGDGQLQVGDVLRQRFEITAVLGAGGMGTVYRATDLLKREARDEHTDVALKVLNTALGDARLSFMALQRETRRAQQLAHPNIVTVYDFDRADGVIYMTMEFMQGQPLEDLLKDHPDGLPADKARRTARDLINGLSYAHQRGIVHADLKPENVFVLEDGTAKILDFGIARAYRSERKDIVEEAVRGFTPRYATPELMAGQKASPTDDIYALACVLYQTFTGHHPYGKASGAKAKEQGLKPQPHKVFRRYEWRCLANSLGFEANKRPADARQFSRQFLPSPGRRGALAVAVIAVIAAASYTALYSPETGPDIAFEDLPLASQQQVTRDLADAGLFRDQGDLNTALQLFDAALRTHPGNREAMQGMNATSEAAIERVLAAHQRGDIDRRGAQLAIEALLEYESLPSQSRTRVRQAIEQINN